MATEIELKLQLSPKAARKLGSHPLLEGIPSQNLLFLINAQGDWVAVRPSGTEPKVKAYVGVRDKSAWSADLESKCHERLVALCHFANGLLES